MRQIQRQPLNLVSTTFRRQTMNTTLYSEQLTIVKINAIRHLDFYDCVQYTFKTINYLKDVVDTSKDY